MWVITNEVVLVDGVLALGVLSSSIYMFICDFMGKFEQFSLSLYRTHVTLVVGIRLVISTNASNIIIIIIFDS